MKARRPRRRPAAAALLPALLLLSMGSAGAFSTGVSSSSERIVEITVTAEVSSAAGAGTGPVSR